MNVADYTYLINKPDSITETQTDALANVLSEFPYFQSARALRLKGLYNQNSFKYNYALKVTAAHTTDRAILFDFITSENFTIIQKEHYDKKHRDTHNVTFFENKIITPEQIREIPEIRIDSIEQSILTSIKESTTAVFEEKAATPEIETTPVAFEEKAATPEIETTPAVFEEKAATPEIETTPAVFEEKAATPEIETTPAVFEEKAATPEIETTPAVFEEKAATPEIETTPVAFEEKIETIEIETTSIAFEEKAATPEIETTPVAFEEKIETIEIETTSIAFEEKAATPETEMTPAVFEEKIETIEIETTSIAFEEKVATPEIETTPVAFEEKAATPEIETTPAVFEEKAATPEIETTPAVFEEKAATPEIETTSIAFEEKVATPETEMTPAVFEEKAATPETEMTPAVFEEQIEVVKEESIKNIEEHLEIGKPLGFTVNEKHSFQEWLQLSGVQPIDRKKESLVDETKEVEKKNIDVTAEKTTLGIDEIETIDEEKKKKTDIIDKFIETNPRISPIKSGSPAVIIQFDINHEENSHLMTETLAKVYLEQKKYTKAIQAYEILILKYPEKISFFADRISDIKILQQNNNNN